MSAFMLQWQNWVVTTEIIQLTKLKYLLYLPLQKEPDNPVLSQRDCSYNDRKESRYHEKALNIK